MANTKISALTALTGADLATGDQFAVVDTSAAATKSITVAELKLGIMPAPGPIGATTPSTGAFTTVSAAGNNAAVTVSAATGTAVTYCKFSNTGGNYYVGVESSVGGGLIFGGAPYALAINSESDRPVQIGVANLLIGAFSSTGLAVVGTLSATGIVTPGTFTTGTRPAKTLGGIIFDTTLNKLLIGGVSAWEVVTSV